MTKTLKMSLAAAVAVAGLSTTASAGSLADAIQDTSIKGKVEVGYNYTDTDVAGTANDTTENEMEYDIDIEFTTKVNDTVSANVAFQADHATNVRDESTDASKANDITLTKMYFTAKTGPVTTMVGKQTQPTPFLDDDRGDGIVALAGVGPVTVGAGHFTGMTGGGDGTDGSNVALNLSQRDISALALIGTFGPVSVNAWYLMATGSDTTTAAIEQGLDGYSVNVKANVGPVALEVAHASLEIDAEGANSFDSESLTKAIASANVGPARVLVGYGMTNDAGHQGFNHTRLHGVDLTDDNDAATNFAMEQTKLDDYNDADALLVGAGATFADVSVDVKYLMATVQSHTAGVADIDADEIQLDVAYAMSKNFNVSALYSNQEIDADGTANDTDTDSIQLSLKYSF
jgi:hypothetical protein